jgi:uncharacterized lipoprotein YajG
MTKTIKRLLPAALAVLLAGCAMQPVDSTTARYIGIPSSGTPSLPGQRPPPRNITCN